METFTKKIRSLVLVVILFITGQVFAGTPTWSRVDYTNSTTFVGIVKIIQYTPTFGYTPVAGDYIGAFVGTECRMVAQIFANGSDLYVSSVIQGGDNCAPGEPNCTAGGSETVTFRLWSNTGSKEYPSIKGDTLTYPGSNIGSTTPYEIGKGKTGKDLISLKINGATFSPAFSSTTLVDTATVSTLPLITDYIDSISYKATIKFVYATNLNGTLAERTTTITVTSESGYTKTYTIIFKPSCTLTSAPTIATPNSVCIGNSTTLTATAVSGSTVSWYSDAKATALLATGSSYTATPSLSSNTYYVTLSNASCVSPIASVTVTVNPLPTVIVTSANPTLCIGSTTILTASGAASFSWNTNLGTGASKVVSPGITTIYTVTGTNANSCTAIASANVIVYNLPNITANSSAFCNGLSTTITANGGVSYLWSNSTSTQSIIVSPPFTTTYTVTGTDGNGCKNTTTSIVTVNPLPTVVASATQPIICNGKSTTVTASGAILYTWNQAAGLVTPPSGTTTYSVTGTDKNGCIGIGSTTVKVNPLPSIILSASLPSICNGYSTTINATGAVSYIWDNSINPGSSNIVSPTSSTMYNVTGTDGNSCINYGSIFITVNNLPNVTVTQFTKGICKGLNTLITASGASSYIWDNAEINQSITVAPDLTKTYSVTGIDANNCKNTATTTLTINALPTITASVYPTAVCNGYSSKLNALGGLSYVWDIANGGSVSPSKTTTYNVTGFDANGCTNIANVTLTVNSLPTIIADASSLSICKGLSSTISATGGVSYIWNNATSNIISPDSSTTYTVTGTDDNGCKNTSSVTVTVNNLPTITASANPIAVCSGSATTISVKGANSYVWDNSSLSGISTTFIPTNSGSYSVTGKDLNGCISTSNVSVTVTTPTLPTSKDTSISVNAVVPQLTANGNGTVIWYDATGKTVVNTGKNFTPNINTSVPSITIYKVTNTENTCESAPITVTFTVSSCTITAPSVNNTSMTLCSGDKFGTFTASGSNIVWYDKTGTISVGSGATFTPKNAGDYYVSQFNVCEGPKTKVSVTVNSLPIIDVKAIPSIICDGSNSILEVSGASSYVWSTNTNGITNVSPNTTTTYVVTGTDGNGCKSSNSTIVTVNQRPTIVIQANPISICAGATATITTSGATSYIWDNSKITSANAEVQLTSTTTYSVTGTDAIGCTNTGTTTVTVNPLPSIKLTATKQAICKGDATLLTASGTSLLKWNDINLNGTTNNVMPDTTTTYSVTGTDANGCSGLASTVIIVNAIPTLNAYASPNSICLGKSTTLGVTGATTLVWDNNLETTALISVSPTSNRTYTVTGTDAHKCTSIATISVVVNQLPTVTITSDLNKICVGGNALLTTNGAVLYSWDNNINNTSAIISPTKNTTYSVTGTDGNKCTNVASTSVTVLAKPTISATATTPICKGKSTTLTATGAVSYIWDNKFNGSSTTLIPDLSTTYTVTGFDGNGCQNIGSVDVKVNGLPSIIVSANLSTVCSGSTSTLTAQGASSYNWSNIPANTSTQIVTPGSLTTYYVTGTDVNGCVNNGSVLVNVTTPSLAISGGDKSIMINDAIPSLTASGTSIRWYLNDTLKSLTPTNLFTPSFINNKVASITTFKVTNTENSCESAPINITLTISNCTVSAPTVDKTAQSICVGNKFSAFTATGTNIKWYDANNVNPIATGTTFTPTSGTADYYVSQTNGCESPIRTKVSAIQNTLPNVKTDTSSITICVGKSASLGVSGASSYNWNNTLGTVIKTIVSPTISTTYIVTGVDGNGCSNTASTIVIVNQLPTITITANPSVVCNGISTTIESKGGLNYIWNNAKITSNVSVITPGTTTIYSVTGTDGNSCTNVASVSVTVKDVPSALINSTGTTVCEGNSGVLTAANATGTVNWYKIPSSTIIANTTTITVTVAGTYQVSQSVNGCESAKQNVIFTVNNKPAPVTITGVSLDFGNTIPTFDAKQIVNWYSDINGIKTLITKASTFTPTIDNSKASTSTFDVEVPSTTGCNSDMTQFTVEIKSPNCPSAPTVTVNPICAGETGTIVATGSTGTTITWYDSQTGGNILGSGATLSVNATGKYYASQTNGCESQRTLANVKLIDKVALTITAPSTIKSTDAPVIITVSPIGGTLFGNGIVNSQFDPSLTTIGNHVITYSFVDQGCTSTTTKTISVIDASLNLNALIAAITTAGNLAQNTNTNHLIGDSVGQYPNSAVVALTNATTIAISVRDSSKSQSIVDNETTILNAAIDTFNKSQIKAGDNSALATLIKTATDASTNAAPGQGIGQYPQSAIDALNKAIKAATDVKNSTTALQAQVDNAKQMLQTAIDTFNKTKITIINATGIAFANPTNVQSLQIGESVQLAYILTPIGSTAAETLVWSSSDNSVATVDQTGKVTIVGEGTVTIHVNFKNTTSINSSLTVKGITDVAVIESNRPEVYPTVSSDVVYIKRASLVKNIQVVSSNGATVKDIKSKADIVILDITDLSSGSYFILLHGIDGSITTKQILKQ